MVDRFDKARPPPVPMEAIAGADGHGECRAATIWAGGVRCRVVAAYED